jgi:hypothetical protein
VETQYQNSLEYGSGADNFEHGGILFSLFAKFGLNKL